MISMQDELVWFKLLACRDSYRARRVLMNKSFAILFCGAACLGLASMIWLPIDGPTGESIFKLELIMGVGVLFFAAMGWLGWREGKRTQKVNLLEHAIAAPTRIKSWSMSRVNLLAFIPVYTFVNILGVNGEVEQFAIPRKMAKDAQSILAKLLPLP